MKPTSEDRAALRLLLQREDLSDYDAEFVESLRNWGGPWSLKQSAYFETICEKYLGGS